MILHVDMDAFYASIEQRDRPELAGQPVVVGGTPEGRGVVAAASYEARQYGVHSAMPAVTARRLCPHAVFLPSRMEYYARVSEQIRQIFAGYTPLVEPLSLDEAFLDVRASQPLFGSTIEIGRSIKRDIGEQLSLIASVGVAPNKFLAKLASDLEKPDGFVVVDPQRVQEFLHPLAVGRLWGVGKVTGRALDDLGVRTIEDVQRLPFELLEREFGEHGKHLWELARGIDERSVVPDREAKSVSHETTFAQDVDDPEILRAWVMELAEQVGWRLRRHGLQGRTVHLKIRFSDFRTLTRARTLPHATNVTQEIWAAAAELLATRVPRQRLPVRLVGVGLSGFDTPRPVQRLLFGDEQHEMQAKLDEAADEIRQRFGRSSLSRATRLLHDVEHQATPRATDLE